MEQSQISNLKSQMPGNVSIWQSRDVALAFLDERSLALPFRKEQLDVLLCLLGHARTPVRRVLDLGCGDGVILAAVLPAFPDALGIGLDFSPPMLERAQERLVAFGDRAQLLTADLADANWRSELTSPCDAIVSGFAIHHLPHERKRALYAEIYEALTPGGVFVNCEHVASPNATVEAMFDEANAEHLWRQRTARGESVTLEQVLHEYLTRPDRAANILASVEEQVAWLRDIGFVDVDCFWKWFELALFGGFREA